MNSHIFARNHKKQIQALLISIHSKKLNLSFLGFIHLMHALKQWKSVTGRSAWTFSETRQQFYLHHYLPEMPDLNLKQPQLREEIKAIFRHWLSQNGVMGVHIGSLDLLIENEDNTLQIEPDVKQCVEFLTGLVTNKHIFVLTTRNRLSQN